MLEQVVHPDATRCDAQSLLGQALDVPVHRQALEQAPSPRWRGDSLLAFFAIMAWESFRWLSIITPHLPGGAGGS